MLVPVCRCHESQKAMESYCFNKTVGFMLMRALANESHLKKGVDVMR